MTEAKTSLKRTLIGKVVSDKRARKIVKDDEGGEKKE